MPRYRNQIPQEPRSLGDVLRWKWAARPVKWPEWVEVEPQQTPDRGQSDSDLSVTPVNHSTVLIGYHQRFFLTDPIWSERASPFAWIGPKRVHAPGLCMEELPPLEAILLSHNHYDHFDLPTLGRIAKVQDPLVLVGTGDGYLARSAGFSRVVELEWWEHVRLGELKIHYTPTVHFSARGIFDRMKSLWGAYVLESEHGHVYFGGDSAMGPHYRDLRRRFGGFRCSMLPIGAYEPRWFMKSSHIDPDEAVEAHRELDSRYSIAIHHGTFSGLTDEGYDEPGKRLMEALASRGIPGDQFAVVPFGYTVHVD